MRVGDLVVMKMSGSLWLVMSMIAETILVQNVKTGYRSWMMKPAFEVISASR